MLRLLLVVAFVCVCALAQDTFYPTKWDCSFHISVDSSYARRKRSSDVMHYYGFVGDEEEGSVLKIVEEDDSYILVRCDMMNDDDNCYVKRFSSSSCADTEYEPLSEFISELEFDVLENGFEYDDDEYPEEVMCPDSNKLECYEYCDDPDDPSECIIVDDQDRLVETAEGVIISYFDAPSAAFFADKTCDEKTLSAPTNPCSDDPGSGSSGSGGSGRFGPNKLDCAFHVVQEETYNDRRRADVTVEYWGMINDHGQMLKKVSEDETVLIRCDVENDKDGCYAQFLDEDECSVQHSFLEEYLNAIEISFGFDETEYPKNTQCPGGSDGCKEYVDDDQNTYIVDANGRVVEVYSDDSVSEFTYLSDVSVDVFDSLCEDEPLETATNPCEASSSSATPSGSSKASGASSSTSSATPSTPSSPSTPSTSSTADRSSVNPSPSSGSVTKAAVSVVVVAIFLALF